MCMITTSMGSQGMLRSPSWRLGDGNESRDNVIIPKSRWKPPWNHQHDNAILPNTTPSLGIINNMSIALTFPAGQQKSIRSGAVRGLNPGPLAPKARIIPLDQQPIVVNVRYRSISGLICSEKSFILSDCDTPKERVWHCWAGSFSFSH